MIIEMHKMGPHGMSSSLDEHCKQGASQQDMSEVALVVDNTLRHDGE